MAQMFPRRIELTTAEAFDLVAVLDAVHEVLVDSEWTGLVLEVEDVHAMLVEKLFPEDQE